jgi:cytochrome c peroxidase
VFALLSAPAIAETDTQRTAIKTLGSALFFDKRVSRDGTIACASCHRPDAAYADTRATSSGHGGASGLRNAPSLLNVRAYTRWGWDRRNSSLETQAVEPLLSPTEHGFADARQFLSQLKAIPALAERYRQAFGEQSPFTMENVGTALAAFMRALPQSAPTPAAGHDKNVEQGKRLFEGKAACHQCHVAATGFTDNQAHLGYRGRIDRDAATQTAMDRARLRTLTGHYRRALNDPAIARLGAFIATLDPADAGTFRTPSLVHVARTAPYMHDGSIPTLRDATLLELRLRSPEVTLSAAEVDALLAYLTTLGGNGTAGPLAHR